MAHPFHPLLLFLFLFLHLSSATDTISATNPSLSGSQTLTSQQGNFVLGFFKPGNSFSSYIGIWYKKVSIQTPVWVANRATPISDPTTSKLTISSDGNLVLLNPSKNIIWSTNINSSTPNTEAILMDSGNLVLRDSTNTSDILWQSIEHPTHTWLPGGKLARNQLTGVSQRLTSWKNSDDPSPGSYSLEIDPDGSSQYLIQWNRSVTFWSSGLWDGTIFTNVPEMTQAYVYNFNYINDSQENYFTYSMKNDSTLISRFVMDVSGQIRQFTWIPASQQWSLFWSQPKVQCGVYAFCGAFGSCNVNETPFCNCVDGFVERSLVDWALNDHTGGCVRRTPLQCGSGSSTKADKDKFLPKPNMGLPDNSVGLNAASVGDCEAACLNNCSCSAYIYNYNSTDEGCSVWYGDLLNLQELSSGSGGILYLRLAASELKSNKSNKVMVSALVVGAAVGVLAFIVIVWVMICRRRRRRLISASKAVEGGLVSFRYSDLVRATKNFSEKLGGGGFGSVFKGTLPGTAAIAVKMLEGLRQGEKQFRAEVSTIGTIQHVNLVRLRGFCSEGDKKLLVYDYMPKSSLDSHLFQESSTVLDWKTRYQIAIGIARGLVYLHEKCRECIIHCDIKPENILLDESFIPKVADFGLAKLVGRDFSRVLTTMRGTRGYLAPEWISGVAITAKADVYSYGMMLFEIISGRRNSETSEGGPPLNPNSEPTGLLKFFDTEMESKEIRSPSEPSPAPVDLGTAEGLSRKKLGIYFVESDERRFPAIGGEYVGGTTPVNIRGKPIEDLSKTGGWIAAFFIFGNEMAERMAYFGLSVNMVAFMFYVMHRPFSSSANAVNNFLGISQASSVLGGFLADAYLGRYWTIAIFTTIYLVGLAGITLCATMRVFVPNQAGCDQLSILLGSCEQAKPWQMLYLYAVLYVTAFGAAGIRPCVSSFGADQFDERSRDYKAHLGRFFNFFYLSVTVGAIVAFTMVVYIQMKHGWGSAFGSLAIAMGMSNAVFFIGTPLYRHRLPGGSPLTRVAQVLVAAFRKRNKPFSDSVGIGLYELQGKRSAIKGSGKIEHTDDFRCLDKAALQLKEDVTDPNPWKLCTVTQVEEVKILVKLLPIPACTIMLSVILTEFLTLSVQQAYTLNTHMGHLKLPVTCMPVFPGISIFLILSLYYSTFAPLSRRITGHPQGASQLQRVGLGLAVSILSVAWAGVFERYRRNYAVKNGFEGLFLSPMPELSAYWLLIQYCLIGIAEVFCIVGLLEFLYQEAPDAMRSVGSAYAAVAGGLGCFVATIINNIVKSTTGNESEGRPSWLSQNINTGRFDYLYWLMAILSLINFGVFLFFARRYKYRVTT